MAPGQPPMKSQGVESVRSLGGLWIVGDGHGEMPGRRSGDDADDARLRPEEKRFVGTFVGSMMTHLWIYDGALDAAGKVLTLDAEGPSFAGDGTMAKYQDIIEIRATTTGCSPSRVLGDDGKWNQFMTAHYRRRRA